MKITLNMMDVVGIIYSWKTIYIALLHDFIDMDEVEKYAIKKMESDLYEESEFINDLIWGGKGREEIIYTMLETGLVKDPNLFEEYELNKIKYSILCYLKRQYIASNEVLLRKLAEVYADFNYPEDMSDFIYYMPTNNKETPTKEEGEKIMISKFNKYLKKLKRLIELDIKQEQN